MIVTLDGLPGSGNTTATQKVAELLKYKVITTGEIWKNMAQKYGVAPENFSDFWKKEGGGENLHKKIDQMQINKAKEAKEKGEKVILNGKLAAAMLKDIADIKIFLIAPFEVRIKRVMNREKTEYDETKKEIEERFKHEIEDWTKIYGINYTDQKYYDIILNTGNLNKEQMTKTIANIIKNWEETVCQ